MRAVAYGASGVLLVLIIVFGTLAWQATRNAISLDMLRGTIEAAVRARLPSNADVTIGTTALSYDLGQGVILRARDVRLSLPGAANIDAAELSTVTTLGAMIGGRVDLNAVTVTGIDVGLSLPPQRESSGSEGTLLSAIASSFAAQLLGAEQLLQRAGLEDVTLNDVTLQLLEGGQPGPALNIAEAQWQPLGTDRSQASMRIVEETGDDWNLTLERQQDTAGVTLTAGIVALPVSTLAPEFADGDGLYYDSSIDLQARLVVGEDGALAALDGALSTAPGAFSVTGKDVIADARVRFDFALGASGDRITIPSGEIQTQAGHVLFEGVADLSEPGGVTLVTRVRGGELPTTLTDHPVQLTGGGIVARVDFSDLGIQVERLQVVTEEGTASAVGQASLAGASPGVSFAISLSEMPVSVAHALWPPFIAGKSRQWIETNVRSGTLGPATLQVALPPDAIGERGRNRVLPSYALIGSVPFRDAEFLPLLTFPLIRDAQGTIDFANATATITARSGSIEVDGRGSLAAGGTTFAIPELGRPEAWGNLHLVLAGPAQALAELSNTPPLAVAAGRGIEADWLSGDAHLALDARIALFGGSMGEIKPTFRLALTDFSSTGLIDGRLIEQANLVLEGSPEAFTVRGDGTLDGVQASIDLILGSGASGQTDVTLLLDDEAREHLGLGLDWLVQGPVQASIRNTDGLAQRVALDLKEARVSLSFLGWEKGPGVPATASFLMEKTEEGTNLTELLIAGDGFGAEGELSIDADGEMRELDLAHVALRPGDDLSASITANGTGYDARVSGAVADARGLIRAVSSGFGEDAADMGTVRISVDVDTVTGQNDVVLSNVSGSLVVSSAGLDSASVTGGTGSGQTFEWMLGTENGARFLRVFAGDGGALIRFAGIYARIADGSLILDYSGPTGGLGSGVVLLNDFRLLNETALAPALQAPRRMEDEYAVERTQAAASGDLSFAQLRVPFTQQDWVISIADAALRGSMLGATAEGVVNVSEGRMAITGTFIPAFGINNIAGAIPLIGTILGGGRDEGLVGITYKLFGPIESPQMTMNPMSAIAPGIFRKIFEYR